MKAYLAAADQEGLFYASDAEALDRSLVLSLLFQPGTLFVPEIFLFLPRVAGHVLKNEASSVLSAALSSGLLQVAERYGDAVSFEQLLARLRSDGIVGIDRRADEVAHRLDIARDDCDDPDSVFFPWPQWSVGEQFETRLRRAFGRSLGRADSAIETADSAKIRRFLEVSHEWRYQALDEARELRESHGDRGIRRGELLNIVARRITDSNDGYGSIGDLLSNAPDRIRPQLRDYWRLVTQCYQINQARAFDGVPSVPGFDYLSAFFLDELLTEGFSDNSKEVTFDLQLKVPPTSSLLQLPLDRLLALRRYEGEAYFAALRRWSTDDLTDGTREASEVERAAKAYAKNLISNVPDRESPLDVVASIWKAATRTSTKRVLGAASGVALAGASFIPGVGQFVPLVAATGGAAYVFWRVLVTKRDNATLRGVQRRASPPEISVLGAGDAPQCATNNFASRAIAP